MQTWRKEILLQRLKKYIASNITCCIIGTKLKEVYDVKNRKSVHRFTIYFCRRRLLLW